MNGAQVARIGAESRSARQALAATARCLLAEQRLAWAHLSTVHRLAPEVSRAFPSWNRVHFD
jgi:hypothetical protein